MTFTLTQIVCAIYIALLLHTISVSIITHAGQVDILTGFRDLLQTLVGGRGHGMSEPYTTMQEHQRQRLEAIPQYARHNPDLYEQYEEDTIRRMPKKSKTMRRRKPAISSSQLDNTYASPSSPFYQPPFPLSHFQEEGMASPDEENWRRYQQEDFFKTSQRDDRSTGPTSTTMFGPNEIIGAPLEESFQPSLSLANSSNPNAPPSPQREGFNFGF
jgi:hypothetical protein